MVREAARNALQDADLGWKDIDAVIIAGQEYQRILPSIHAVQAGKDVYVEKPISHNLWEGRKMVEAARKYDRIVQYGNHNHGHHTGEMRLSSDRLGEIQVVGARAQLGQVLHNGHTLARLRAA